MAFLTLPLIFLAAAAAPPAPAPRMGGIAYEPYGGPSFGRQAQRVRERAEDGRETGQLSRRQARAARREARQIGRLSDRYAHGGYSEAEQRELQARIDYLNGMVSAQRSNGAKGSKGKEDRKDRCGR